MFVRWQGICLSAVVLFSFVTLCHAQSTVTPEDEYKKLVKVNEDIQPLGETPFGENVSLYNGGLSFEQTDISASGDGPLLEVTRTFQLPGRDEMLASSRLGFADWEWNLPRIVTTVSDNGSSRGWRVDWPSNPNLRCSHFGAPPTITLPGGSAQGLWGASEWWNGYQLVVPGHGSQELLPRTPSNTLSPQMEDMSFPIVTQKHWMVSCLGATANGEPGEAFLAVAPDGTKYWLNHLVYSPAATITKPYGSGPEPFLVAGGMQPMAGVNIQLERRRAAMLVTRVEDRFGNSLTYTYTDGKLTAITASDGRSLSVHYNGPVDSITLNPGSSPARTWTYQYSPAIPGQPMALSAVVLPDGTRWSFSLRDLAFVASTSAIQQGNCNTPGTPTTATWSGSIVHPSGLTGTFKVKARKQGRSYVPRECWAGQPEDPLSGYALIPNAWYGLSITEKTFSGAGISPAQTWSYQYSAANQSWLQDCSGSNCAATVWTDVLDPAGRAVRSTFSNRYDISEGRLIGTAYYTGTIGSTAVRSETQDYAAPGAGPWPAYIGANLQPRANDSQVSQLAPLNRRTITQDGDTYTWQATAFNAYAQVTKTRRFSDITPSQTTVEEQTSYLNDLPHWVLGLPTQTKSGEVVNGAVVNEEVVDEYDYDLTDVTLKKRWRFGQEVMAYTFNPQGQLADFTNGNAKTTTLSNYKRGIPQTITTPDAKTQTLLVDDFGQITSITDPMGSKTSYTYDLAGRLTGISYPTGDEQAWLPKTFAYAYVTGAERGLSANHWRRTVSQGSSLAVTYFDALLRPVLSDSFIDGVGGSNTTVLTNYDSKGQTVFASYPDAAALNFTSAPSGIDGTASTYDALGRLTQVQQTAEAPFDIVASTTTYLPGARKQITDPKGNVTTTSYQVFDQPSYDAVIKVVAPTGVTQTISRDRYGNPRIINQSGIYGTQSLSFDKIFVYDSYHRLCRTSEPESGSTVMGYDGANNLVWSVSGAPLSNDGSCHPELAQSDSVITRGYDAMNRLTTILAPLGTQSTTYTYDDVGNLTMAASGTSTWSGTYNKRGMPTGESLLLDTQSPWAIGYAHDAYGHLSLIQYPDGESVSYAPDALGRPTQVGSYLTSIGYHPNGEVAWATLGNGAFYVADQNERQLLSNFSYAKGDTVNLSEDLVYDKNGNITQFTDLADGAPIRDKTFSYDALNRLTSATADALWGTETYAYDPINNIRERIRGSQTTTYNYDSRNRLSSLTGAGATSFDYDLRGNVTSKGGVSLEFDQKNQLVSLPGVSYAYDAAGRRVSKTPTSGSPTFSFYSQAGRLMYQVEPGLARTTSFAYLGRKLVGDNESVFLGVPGAVSFSANSNDGSYTVSWGAVLAATSYSLQESANGGGWITVYTGGAASKALSGRDGGSYIYQVRGCIGSTCGAWSSSATLGVPPALPTVTVPSGTINGTYTVSWTAPVGSTGYDVQERLDSGTWTMIASNTPATSISRPGTASGSYTYQVSAKNSHGNRGWAASSAVTVDTTYGVLPAAPASFTVPDTSSTGSASLSWSAATLATRYVVEQGVGSVWSGIYDGSATSKAVSGLANGSYIYRVQACNTYGCSSWKAGSATLVVTHPPDSAPTVTTPATNASGSYTVSWDAVSTATSYTLQEQVNSGSWTTIQTSSATSKAISGKGNGTYGYQVQACNVGGCSAWSSTKTTAVLLTPSAPGSITVPATSSGSIAVSWSASATATSYTLQERLGTGSWSNVYTGAATSSTRTVTASGSYTYQVQACNASGCSAYKASSAVTVTIPPAGAPTLTVPVSSSTGSYTASWTAVTGATGYTLQEQINAGAWTTIQTSSAISRAISGNGNGSYGYRVQACNAGGCGAWSGTKTITVALVPPAPTGVQVVQYTVNAKREGYRAQWNAVSGATSYEARRTDTNTNVYSGTLSSFVIVEGVSPIDPDEVYDVQVRACNAVGCSGWAP